MRESEKFKIDIYKLSNGDHHYEFSITQAFFEEFPISGILEGTGSAKVTLNKSESHLEAYFTIEVNVKLECDRTLETYPFDMVKDEHLIFKFGDEDVELDDNIVMIHRDTQRLYLQQYIYEFIHMAVPMKKLHPRFGDDSGTDELIYRSASSSTATSDPRWEQLKNLKK
ncbi:MAG: DUF177 domain-containing protein [Bacteroidota bacterium]